MKKKLLGDFVVHWYWSQDDDYIGVSFPSPRFYQLDSAIEFVRGIKIKAANRWEICRGGELIKSGGWDEGYAGRHDMPVYLKENYPHLPQGVAELENAMRSVSVARAALQLEINRLAAQTAGRKKTAREACRSRAINISQ